MLTIRSEQMAAFAAAKTETFVKKTAADLQRILPRHCAALGPEGVREAIDFGMKRASGYGIVSEPGVLVYVRLMFMFGREFDRKYEWAQRALRDTSEGEGDAAAANLSAAAEQFLREAASVVPNR